VQGLLPSRLLRRSYVEVKKNSKGDGQERVQARAGRRRSSAKKQVTEKKEREALRIMVESDCRVVIGGGEEKSVKQSSPKAMRDSLKYIGNSRHVLLG